MSDNYMPFSTALMGSLPRSAEVLTAKALLKEGKITHKTYNQVIRDETKKVVDMQEAAGVDIITNGELDRDNYISYTAQKVSGIRTMTNDEVMDYSPEDVKEKYRQSLKERDAADANINNPIAIGKIDTDAELNQDEIDLLRELTDKPLKTTLPSPYLLTRSVWLTGVSDRYYSSRNSLGKDITRLICNEVKRLIKRGVATIQIDDPVLTQIVFSDDEDQTFY